MLSSSRRMYGYSMGATTGLTVPSRLDYGGRASYVTLMLPMLVLSVMSSILWVTHSSAYLPYIVMIWLMMGIGLLVVDFYVSGMTESRFQGTASYKINGMASFGLMVAFEVAFFSGTYWTCALSRVESLSEVSMAGSLSDMCMFGSWESTPGYVGVTSLDSSAVMSVASSTGGDIFSRILIVVMLNLYILLLVTLLLQYIHRMYQMNELA